MFRRIYEAKKVNKRRKENLGKYVPSTKDSTENGTKYVKNREKYGKKVQVQLILQG